MKGSPSSDAPSVWRCLEELLEVQVPAGARSAGARERPWGQRASSPVARQERMTCSIEERKGIVRR